MMEKFPSMRFTSTSPSAVAGPMMGLVPSDQSHHQQSPFNPINHEKIEKKFTNSSKDEICTDFEKVSRLQFKSIFTYTEFDPVKCSLSRRYVVGDPLEKYLLLNSKNLSFGDLLQLSIEICEAVEFLHKNMIPVVSMTPSNIIVTPEGFPILVDFGITSTMKREKKKSDFIFYGPEAVFCEPDSFSLFEHDIWSFGVVLYLILTEMLPWPTKNLPRLMKLMNEAVLSFPSGFPSELGGLISKMVNAKLDSRPTIEYVKRILHRVYENCIDDMPSLNQQQQQQVDGQATSNLPLYQQPQPSGHRKSTNEIFPSSSLRDLVPKMIINNKNVRALKKGVDVCHSGIYQMPRIQQESHGHTTRKRNSQVYSTEPMQPSFLAGCLSDE